MIFYGFKVFSKDNFQFFFIFYYYFICFLAYFNIFFLLGYDGHDTFFRFYIFKRDINHRSYSIYKKWNVLYRNFENLNKNSLKLLKNKQILTFSIELKLFKSKNVKPQLIHKLYFFALYICRFVTVPNFIFIHMYIHIYTNW